MRLLLFPAFLAYLTLAVTASFTHMFLMWLGFFRTFFFAFFFAGVLALNLLIRTPGLIKNFALPYSDVLQGAIVTEEHIQTEIDHWEEWRTLQPTHRDILINLSYLYGLLGQEEKAAEYLQQAKDVDPNNELFSK